MLDTVTALFIKSDSISFNSCINEVLRHTCEYLDVDRAFLFLYKRDSNVLKLNNEWVRKPEFHTRSFIDNSIISLIDFPLWRSLTVNPETWVMNSLENLPDFANNEKEILSKDNTVSCLMTPVFSSEILIGFVCYECVENEKIWSKQEIKFAEQVCSLTSSFLSRSEIATILLQNIQSSVDPPDSVVNSSNILESGNQLNLLSDAIISLLSLDTKEQIFGFAAEVLKKLIPDGYIIFNEYLEDENVMVTRQIIGISQIVTNVIKILGYQPLGKKYTVMTGIRELDIVKSGVLHKIEGGIYELTFGEISKAKGKIIKAIAGVTDIYVCGFHAKGMIFGTANIFLKSKNDVNLKMIESFLRILSLALYRVSTYHDLMDSKRENQDILNNMTEGVISVDSAGNVVYINKAALNISGYSRKEILGRNIRVFLPNPDGYEFFNKKPDYFPISKENKKFELEIMDKMANRKWVSINVIDLRDYTGEISGYQGVVSDLTQSRKKEAALREYELSEATMELRQRFLSNMSHELLTPLTGICGVANIMSAYELPEEILELVGIIEQSSDQMLKIVQSIWDTIGLKEGIHKNIPGEFWLCDLINHNINLFSASARQKKLDLKISCNDTRNLLLVADAMKINQVLSNLLGNAVKFHHEGGNILFCAHYRKGQDERQGFLKFEVIDDGPGIPKEKQALIFRIFEQADTSSSREYDGLGLGLNLAKELVHLMKGEINFKSNPGEGSLFWFEIPVHQGIKSASTPACICVSEKNN